MLGGRVRDMGYRRLKVPGGVGEGSGVSGTGSALYGHDLVAGLPPLTVAGTWPLQ